MSSVNNCRFRNLEQYHVSECGPIMWWLQCSPLFSVSSLLGAIETRPIIEHQGHSCRLFTYALHLSAYPVALCPQLCHRINCHQSPRVEFNEQGHGDMVTWGHGWKPATPTTRVSFLKRILDLKGATRNPRFPETSTHPGQMRTWVHGDSPTDSSQMTFL